MGVNLSKVDVSSPLIADYDSVFSEKLTQELLLRYNSEETYMEHYLGIPVKKGLFKSPLRKDNTPTCAFFNNRSLCFFKFRISIFFYTRFINWKVNIFFYSIVISNNF